jgi:hypothetical protein
MAKESFWFKHDLNARNDPKMMRLLKIHKCEGIGVYWCLIEMMYEQGGYLKINEKDVYTDSLKTKEKLIDFLISESGLFKKDDTKFWSESLLIRMGKRNDIKEKARNSAKVRWGDRNKHDETINGTNSKGQTVIPIKYLDIPKQ